MILPPEVAIGALGKIQVSWGPPLGPEPTGPFGSFLDEDILVLAPPGNNHRSSPVRTITVQSLLVLTWRLPSGQAQKVQGLLVPVGSCQDK